MSNRHSRKARSGGRYTPPSPRYMRFTLCNGCALCDLLAGTDLELVTIHEIGDATDESWTPESERPPLEAGTFPDQHPCGYRSGSTCPT